MSTKPRTREHFPRVKDRGWARRNREVLASRKKWERIAREMRKIPATFEVMAEVMDAMAQAITEFMTWWNAEPTPEQKDYALVK